ncbi:hypothetical protein J132_04447 [Termitomyces sp. J132]|nr:hypothetical protein J132_04447 [Termitomyces sp. J132]
MSTSLYYTPSDMAAIAYTVPFLSQQSTSNDDGFSCREYSAPFLSSHSSYPSVPPYNGYILPHMPSSSPPSTSRNGLPVPNSMPRNPGTLSFHSHVQSVQCVDAPTLNALIPQAKSVRAAIGPQSAPWPPNEQLRTEGNIHQSILVNTAAPALRLLATNGIMKILTGTSRSSPVAYVTWQWQLVPMFSATAGSNILGKVRVSTTSIPNST